MGFLNKLKVTFQEFTNTTKVKDQYTYLKDLSDGQLRKLMADNPNNEIVDKVVETLASRIRSKDKYQDDGESFVELLVTLFDPNRQIDILLDLTPEQLEYIVQNNPLDSMTFYANHIRLIKLDYPEIDRNQIKLVLNQRLRQLEG